MFNLESKRRNDNKPLLEKKVPEYFKLLQEKIKIISEQSSMAESRIYTKEGLL